MNTMKNTSNIMIYILELVMLISFMLVPPLFIWIDFAVLHTNSSEYSLTELTQEFLILICIIILSVRAYKAKENKGFLVLLAGLFAAMFIREGDFLWDKIMRGLWTILALCALLVSALIAYKNKKTVFPTFFAYKEKRGFNYLILGLFILLFFSRIFGTGNLWRAILKEHYTSEFKTAIQEGLELLGYVLIFYGVLLMPKRVSTNIESKN